MYLFQNDEPNSAHAAILASGGGGAIYVQVAKMIGRWCLPKEEVAVNSEQFWHFMKQIWV